jgi:Ca2+-binding EF-hand superfamily protein
VCVRCSDGSLSISEVSAGLKKLGVEVAKEDMAAVFKKFDTDGNLKLDKQEFYELYRAYKSRPAAIVPRAEPAPPAPALPPDVQEVFDSTFDRDSDGKLSVAEVHRGLKKLGIDIPKDRMAGLFSNFDVDGSFRLEPAEFAELYRRHKAGLSVVPEKAESSSAEATLPPAVQAVFEELFDKNGDGTISVSECYAGLKKLGVEIGKQDMAAVFNGFDSDENFRLGKGEFHELYRKYSAQKQQAAIDAAAASAAPAAQPVAPAAADAAA